MTAVDDFISDLQRNRGAAGDAPMIGDIDLFVAALQELSGSVTVPDVLQQVTNGRLTLTTAVPVLTADVTSATTIFFALYNGNRTLIFNGTNFVATEHAELSQTLADNTKSPAAAAADSVYDMFVWNDAGTVRCTRGPAWTDATTRALALERINGVLVNAAAITNGPGENLGTYVGTIATDATPDCNMMFSPAAAAGGAANRLDVWNYYNRVRFSSINADSTASWAAANGPIARNNNSNNGITFVVGVDEDCVEAYTTMNASSSNADGMGIGFGFDATTFDGNSPVCWVPTQANSKFGGSSAQYIKRTGIGRHSIIPLEDKNTAAAGTWQNEVAPAGMAAAARMQLVIMA